MKFYGLNLLAFILFTSCNQSPEFKVGDCLQVPDETFIYKVKTLGPITVDKFSMNGEFVATETISEFSKHYITSCPNI